MNLIGENVGGPMVDRCLEASGLVDNVCDAQSLPPLLRSLIRLYGITSSKIFKDSNYLMMVLGGFLRSPFDCPGRVAYAYFYHLLHRILSSSITGDTLLHTIRSEGAHPQGNGEMEQLVAGVLSRTFGALPRQCLSSAEERLRAIKIQLVIRVSLAEFKSRTHSIEENLILVLSALCIRTKESQGEILSFLFTSNKPGTKEIKKMLRSIPFGLSVSIVEIVKHANSIDMHNTYQSRT